MATGKLPREGELLSSGSCSPVTKSNNICSKPAVMATKAKQAKHPEFPLEYLPDVVLDKIFNLLSPEDLRRVHQVCKAWKKSLVSRPRIDSRRVDLVSKIRLNKENIARGSSLFATPSTTTKESTPSCRSNSNNDGKPGSRSVLTSIESLRNSSARSGGGGGGGGRRILSNLTTPTSRFFRVYEAGKKLAKGQQLFRCPECQSPVPSPMVAMTSTNARRLTGLKKPSTSLSSSRTSSLSSPSNLTNDSGFDSIGDVSNNTTAGAYSINMNQVSSSCSSVLVESSSSELHAEEETPEITLSFIATPDQTTINNNRLEFSGNSLDFNTTTCTNNTEELLDSFQECGGGDDEDEDSSSRMSSPCGRQNDREQSPSLLVKCPNCSFRFCSKCQCTEHPGRACKEIDGDITAPGGGDDSNIYSKDLRLSKKRTKGELRRAARL